MQVEQISVFLENKTGRISEVTGILAEAQINIRALALADTSDFGVFRLIVDNNAHAVSILKKNGFTVGKTDVVAVQVRDEPGGLHHILEILQAEPLNVEYMYAYVRHTGESAIMIFRFDDAAAAIEVLQKNKITVIDGQRLYDV